MLVLLGLIGGAFKVGLQFVLFGLGFAIVVGVIWLLVIVLCCYVLFSVVLLYFC